MMESNVGNLNLIVLHAAVVIQEMGQTCLVACPFATVNTHYVGGGLLRAKGLPWLHKTMHHN